MNHRAEHLSEWAKQFVANHPKLKNGLLTPEFQNRVYIKFEDGSYAFFNYAFLVECDKHDEIAVFTEHCGYFCFPRRGLDEYGMLGDKSHQQARG